MHTHIFVCMHIIITDVNLCADIPCSHSHIRLYGLFVYAYKTIIIHTLMLDPYICRYITLYHNGMYLHSYAADCIGAHYYNSTCINLVPELEQSSML